MASRTAIFNENPKSAKKRITLDELVKRHNQLTEREMMIQKKEIALGIKNELGEDIQKLENEGNIQKNENLDFKQTIMVSDVFNVETDKSIWYSYSNMIETYIFFKFYSLNVKDLETDAEDIIKVFRFLYGDRKLLNTWMIGNIICAEMKDFRYSGMFTLYDPMKQWGFRRIKRDSAVALISSEISNFKRIGALGKKHNRAGNLIVEGVKGVINYYTGCDLKDSDN